MQAFTTHTGTGTTARSVVGVAPLFVEGAVECGHELHALGFAEEAVDFHTVSSLHDMEFAPVVGVVFIPGRGHRIDLVGPQF